MWSVSFHRQSPERTETRNFSYASENGRINRAHRETGSGGADQIALGRVRALQNVDLVGKGNGTREWGKFRSDDCATRIQSRFAGSRRGRRDNFECDRPVGRSDAAD